MFALLGFGFVLLGMAITVPAITWPSVANSLDRSLADLGFVTLLFGGGYTVSSAYSGRLSASRGIGGVLIGGSVSALVALVGVAISGVWGWFLTATFVLGLGGGFVDAGTNTYVATRGGTRAMGSIHGIFGIGAIVGPLLATALLQGGASWRVAYAVLAVLQVAFLSGLWMRVRDIKQPSESAGLVRVGGFWSPVVMWSLLVFLVYGGIGAGAGVWAFTYFTEERGVDGALGGVIVGVYWGAFTASRLLLGAIGERFDPNKVIRWSMVSTATAFAVFWLAGSDWLAAGALIIAGFAHGPLFPLEMLLTPRRVGERLTSRLVGFEIAAANVGGALIPGLMGLAVGISGLSVIPPILVINAVVLVGVVEMLRRSTDQAALETKRAT